MDTEVAWAGWDGHGRGKDLEPAGFRRPDAPRLPPGRIAAIARDLIDAGGGADVPAVARRLLLSAERQRAHRPAAAAERVALALALLAEVERRRRWA